MVTREQKVVQSTQNYVRETLLRWGYTTELVQILDAYPDERIASAIDRTYVAAGFEFDDGGEQAEIGSSLTRRVYNVSFFTFGDTAIRGQNVSTTIKAALERDGAIPLRDIGESDEVVESMQILADGGVRSERVRIGNPRPWERHVWAVTCRIEDYYFAEDVA